ncbi:Beta-fructofuranosidase, insoluble isoenzyme 6 [Dichanthelium oligosanthes]|uniref:Beta-fructofuranosidase, insoluble isoenzyme 6 n=1 Tax=Dichanthelium oligosanthes TaxID=888268 RepID=A0A1E5VYK7_9POAL|nr:Beta-fructofuranosidase, insoluble isoenzyme 6 [Dichanthelium oligosanthes]
MAAFPLAVSAATVIFCLLLPSSSSLPTCVARTQDHVRTAYHFQPAKNWQNGPVYYSGMYHLFYQYNPHGALWDVGNLSWGHSVSGDLVNWADLGNALDPTASFDANGCASGSVTILPDGQPVILYSGIDADRRQVQNIAFPKNPRDPLLREWTKPSYNPIVPLPADVSANNFRDPTTAWLGRDGLWRFAISAVANGVGTTLVYRSADFLRWERNAAPLHASRDAVMAECPDLFPVAERGAEGLDTSARGAGVKHVLKVSMPDTLQDYYTVGRYDDEADTFVPDEDDARGGGDYRSWRRIDHGHLYASKTFFDARRNRRVLWAWVNESDSEADDVDRGWSGLQSFPRALWLDRGGRQLVQWPVEEIETVRRRRAALLGAEVESGGLREIAGIVSSQADVDVVFDVPSLEHAEHLDPDRLLDADVLCAEKGASVRGGIGPFGLLVMASGDDLREHTAVFFRVFRLLHEYTVLMCTDLARSSTKAGVYKPTHGGFVNVDIEKDKSISLRTLIDRSIVESFGGGGRTCMTARVYPEHVATGSSHLYVFNNGSDAVKVPKLEAWELSAASVNVAEAEAEEDGLLAASAGDMCKNVAY